MYKRQLLSFTALPLSDSSFHSTPSILAEVVGTFVPEHPFINKTKNKAVSKVNIFIVFMVVCLNPERSEGSVLIIQ